MNLAIRPDIPTWKEYMDRTDLWKIQYAMHIEIQSSLIPGTLVYDIRPGYITDFRSGPSIVNLFIPKIGDIKLAIAWMIHDVNYHGFLSKKLSDQLLREMLEHAGIGTFKRNAVYYAVKICAGSHYNTLDEDQGPIYNHNKTLVRMRWLDKGQVLKSFNGKKTQNQGLKGPFFKGEKHDKTPKKAHRNGQFRHAKAPYQAGIQEQLPTSSRFLRKPFLVRHNDRHHLQTLVNTDKDIVRRLLMNTVLILMSIHHEWANLIYSKYKTIELRKTAPKERGPFEVYLYDTSSHHVTGIMEVSHVQEIPYVTDELCSRACLDREAVEAYKNQGNGKLYAWHIDSASFYDNDWLTVADALNDPKATRPPQSWQYIKR